MPSAESTAVHEAGHFVVAAVLGVIADAVAIHPDGGGVCTFDGAAFSALPEAGRKLLFEGGELDTGWKIGAEKKKLV
jgi:hypothetical protein